MAALDWLQRYCCDRRLVEHRDVDHEPDSGPGQHAEKYSAHRVDFFIHFFISPRPEFLAGGLGAQRVIRKKPEN